MAGAAPDLDLYLRAHDHSGLNLKARKVEGEFSPSWVLRGRSSQLEERRLARVVITRARKRVCI